MAIIASFHHVSLAAYCVTCDIAHIDLWGCCTFVDVKSDMRLRYWVLIEINLGVEQILSLPKDTLLYPAHDYKGQTVSVYVKPVWSIAICFAKIRTRKCSVLFYARAGHG